MTAAVLAFLVAGAALVLLPGPDSLLVLRSVVLRGRVTAVRTCAGILTGLLVWVAAAALGLAALLRASETAYAALRLAGAAYLLYLGVRALRPRPGAEPVRGLVGTGFCAGVTTNLLNPKVGVFFVTILPGFVPRGAPVAATSLLFGALYVLETAVYFAALLLLVDRITTLWQRPRFRRVLDRVTGGVLVVFGVRLALAP